MQPRLRFLLISLMFSTMTLAGMSVRTLLACTSAAAAGYGTIQLLGGSALTFNGEPSGVDRVNGTNYYYDAPNGTVMNYRNAAISRKADATSRVPLWSASAPNGAFFVNASADLTKNYTMFTQSVRRRRK